MQLMMVGVPSREVGLEVIDKLADAHADGTVTIEDAALVYKNDKGKVKIQQTHDANAKRGALWGGGVGLLVGIVAAPAAIAATVVGGGAGALLAKARDSGVSDKLMKEIGDLIEGSEAAVFVLADDASSLVIAARVEEASAGGAELSYSVVPSEAQDFLREALKLSAAEG